MANSYDLTEDNRGLKLGRLINADLVIIRNRAYKRYKQLQKITIPDNPTSSEVNMLQHYFDDFLDIIQLCDRLLEQ